jgi:hypothetical protein
MAVCGLSTQGPTKNKFRAQLSAGKIICPSFSDKGMSWNGDTTELCSVFEDFEEAEE